MRALRWAGKAAVFALATVVLLELALQLAALATGDRGGAWREGARVRVLCVGDSHTYGAGVERGEAYPARLEEELDARDPGSYSVLNLGLPGLSTTQLSNRLPVWIQRYEPDVLVVWAGVNNSWNRAEEPRAAAAWLEGWLSRVRLYRLIRIWLHDRELERYVPTSREERVWHLEKLEGGLDDQVYTVRHEGVEERIAHGPHEAPPEEPGERAPEVRARTERDLAAMAELSVAAGIPMLLVSYPIEASWYRVVNEATRAVARSHGLPLLESSVPVARIPPDERDWRWATHPGPGLYGAIARDLAPLVLAAAEARSAGTPSARR